MAAQRSVSPNPVLLLWLATIGAPPILWLQWRRPWVLGDEEFFFRILLLSWDLALLLASRRALDGRPGLAGLLAGSALFSSLGPPLLLGAALTDQRMLYLVDALLLAALPAAAFGVGAAVLAGLMGSEERAGGALLAVGAVVVTVMLHGDGGG